MLYFYTSGVLIHVEWCIRLLARMLFNHTTIIAYNHPAY